MIVCERGFQDVQLVEKVLVCGDVKASGITVSTKIAMTISIIYLVPYLLASLVPRSNLQGRSVCVARA